MSESKPAPRRERVERNIYRRVSGVYEIGFKDASGKQRWRTVDGGITAARAVCDQLLAQRARGERVASNGRLRFGDAAQQWSDGPVTDLRPATQGCYRNAVERHLAPASTHAALTRSRPTTWQTWCVNSARRDSLNPRS